MTKVSTTYFGEVNVFPFQATTPVIETLDWITDIVEATDGTEDRHKLREYPRQTFNYKFPLSFENKRPAVNAIYSAIREFWYLPLWTEYQNVGIITSGQTTILCNTTLYNFNLIDVDPSSGYNNPSVYNSKTVTGISAIASDGVHKYFVDSTNTLFKVDETTMVTADSISVPAGVEDITVNDNYIVTIGTGQVYIYTKSPLTPYGNFHVGVSGARSVTCTPYHIFIADQLNTRFLRYGFNGIIDGSPVNYGGNNSDVDIAAGDNYIYIMQYYNGTIKRYNMSGLGYVDTTNFSEVRAGDTIGDTLYALSGNPDDLNADKVIKVYDSSMVEIGHFEMPTDSFDISINDTISTAGKDIAYDVGGFLPASQAGLAMLKSGEDWQIVEIISKTSSSITVLDSEAMVNADLMPVKKGKISGNCTDKTNGLESTLSMRFMIDDGLEFAESTPPQYNGNDVYYDKIPTVINRLNKEISRKQILVDFGIGPFESSTDWIVSRMANPYNEMFNGPSEVYDFKDFLYRRSGKYRSFWSPTFTSDMICVSNGLIESTILVKSDLIIDYAQDRDHIAVLGSNGFYYPRNITAFSQIDENRVELTLNSSLNLQSEDVVSISFMGLCRLNSDKVTFSWVGNSVVEMATSVLELSP